MSAANPSRPQKRSPSDPGLAISGFEDIAAHLTQQRPQQPPMPSITPDAELLNYLQQTPVQTNPTIPATASKSAFRIDGPHAAPMNATTESRGTRLHRVEHADSKHVGNVLHAPAHVPVDADLPAVTSPSVVRNSVLSKLQQFRAAVTKFRSSTDSSTTVNELPQRTPLHARSRFAGDPRDDARLQWADDLSEWRHHDVEARMVNPETLWIMEQLEELFLKYLKPVWWDRFVEGIQDFLTTIKNELLRPVWSLITVPFRALAALLPDIDWPWNFELRGANVSVKQNPFRRMVFDSHLASQVVEHLWNDPDAFLDAGQIVAKDDFSAASRVPVKGPQTDGHFGQTAIASLKRFNLRGIFHSLTRVLLFTRGSRSWTYGRELMEAGIATPRPLAMVEDRIGPLRFRSFVLTESIEGTTLPEFLAKTPLNTLELDRLAGQFARIWHTLGELRLVHGNMHASSFVVTSDRRLALTNLDGTWRHWFDLTFLHRRDRDWLRFANSWRGQQELSAAFRAAVARHGEELLTKPQSLTTTRSLQLQRAA